MKEDLRWNFPFHFLFSYRFCISVARRSSRDVNLWKSFPRHFLETSWRIGIVLLSTRAVTIRKSAVQKTKTALTITESFRLMTNIGARLARRVEIATLIVTVSWLSWSLRSAFYSLFSVELLDDDITDDIKCAQKIFKRHGFSAWYGWKNNCKGKPLPSVDDCFWNITVKTCFCREQSNKRPMRT